MVALLLLTLVAQAPTRDARPAAAPASVSGRITEAGSGRSLPRIVVSLDAPPATRIEAITDAEGRYTFTDIPAGAYVLAAAPERYRSTYLAQRFGETGPALDRASTSRPNLELQPGESRRDADLALTRALAIEGRVLDPSDLPIANVQVNVRRPDGRFVPSRGAATNDLGVYRLYGLAPGRYRVCAEIEGQLAAVEAAGGRLVWTCHIAATAESEASDIVLAGQDATSIDIRVQRAGTFAISGSVVDATGRPLDSGFILAVPNEEHGRPASTRIEAGQFVLKVASRGRYLVTASVGDRNPDEPQTRVREVGYAVVDVQGTDATGISIALTKPVTLPGIVTLEGKDAPSSQQLKLVVSTHPSQDRWWRYESMPPRASVGDDLRFELKDLYRQPRLVSVSNLPSGWAVQAIRLENRDIMFLPTDLTTGSRLEIVLTNRVAKPSARVVVPPGASPRFHVFILPADPARWQGGRQMIAGEEATNDVIRLGALMAGEYLVAALSTDDAITAAQDATRLGDVARVATRVTFGAGDERTIELPLVFLPPRR